MIRLDESSSRSRRFGDEPRAVELGINDRDLISASIFIFVLDSIRDTIADVTAETVPEDRVVLADVGGGGVPGLQRTARHLWPPPTDPGAP